MNWLKYQPLFICIFISRCLLSVEWPQNIPENEQSSSGWRWHLPFVSQMGGFTGTRQGVGDASSIWGLPGRRENNKCDEGEIKRVVREISLARCFLVHNNLSNLT